MLHVPVIINAKVAFVVILMLAEPITVGQKKSVAVLVVMGLHMLAFMMVEVAGMIRNVMVIGVVETLMVFKMEYVINTHKYLTILKTPLFAGFFC